MKKKKKEDKNILVHHCGTACALFKPRHTLKYGNRKLRHRVVTLKEIEEMETPSVIQDHTHFKRGPEIDLPASDPQSMQVHSPQRPKTGRCNSLH